VIRSEKLKDVLHVAGLDRSQQVLLCLAVDPDRPKATAEVRTIALAGGVRDANKWNLSAILGSLAGRAVRTPDGWQLTNAGKADAKKLLGIPSSSHAGALSSLRAKVAGIASAQVREFVEEAICCAAQGYHRAAVVLVWAGALGVLYGFIVSNHLSAFNAEAKRRDPKWRDAKTADDLTRMKEFDFLQVLASMSILGKNVKGELEGCLKLRNGCGHPNSLRIAESRVSAHIEILVLNVFSVYV
jgi:hypothetical protein